MGTLADSLFTVLMSWVRALVSGIWALFSAEHTTALEFLGKNWLLIVAVLVAAGLVIDWIIWLLRWQPYHLWAQRARRMLRIEEPEEEEETHTRAHAAVTRSMGAVPMPEQEDAAQEDADDGLAPLYISQSFDEEQAKEAIAYADSVPDEELRAYPGMRYGAQAAPQEDMGGTAKYTAVRAEGPGAAEVTRRRAEIDAWQQQMQDEARAQAEQAARAAREAREAEQARLAKEAYEAEQARLAKEAYEAEQARLEKEAYEAEQARLAQEAYERELAEYERQKAQYELELAEYERQKAAYEAQLAAQEAAEREAQTAQAVQPGAQGGSRRRRAAVQSYSDYIEGDTVSELPAPPAWPQMEQAVHDTREKDRQPEKKKKSGALLSRMAKMIEPEEEELITRKSLPPRVDPHEAYRPAKTPRSGRKA